MLIWTVLEDLLTPSKLPLRQCRKVFWHHPYQHKNILISENGVGRSSDTIHINIKNILISENGVGRSSDTIHINIKNILISGNGVWRPSKIIQTAFLMCKLIGIRAVSGSTKGHGSSCHRDGKRLNICEDVLIVSIKTNKLVRVMFLFCVWNDITSVKVCETSKS